MSAVQHIRSATAADHDRVDAAFGGFDLADPVHYRAFLTAHAMALPAVEQALHDVAGLPPLRVRTSALYADLAELGVALPQPLPMAPLASLPAAFGAAYVIEGSRLGGGLLARRVPTTLPRGYLSAIHQAGEWRRFLAALDEAAGDDEAWIAASTTSARAVFALYAEAAAFVGEPAGLTPPGVL